MADDETIPAAPGEPTGTDDKAAKDAAKAAPTSAPAPKEAQTANAGADDDEAYDKDRAMATIKKLRDFEKAAKAQAKELETLRAEKQVAEDAKLSETERMSKRLAELEGSKLDAETRITETLKRAEFRVAAAQLGAVDPDLCYLAADLSAVTVDTDKGAVEGVKDALEALKKSKPFLFKVGIPAAEPFNPAGNQGQHIQETDAQRRARLYGGGSGIFDPNAARTRGGGVIIVEKTPRPPNAS